MDNFKNYFDSYVWSKYFSIINSDKTISFLPMSQKSPTFEATPNINNSWNIFENDTYNGIITQYTYIYKDHIWVKINLD